ncbi:MAG: hypothetical protein HY301_16520 [Verrucomicrobia bacterium]|nr:hypothetical protein [Verrucomicrobiota bacterium]
MKNLLKIFSLLAVAFALAAAPAVFADKATKEAKERTFTGELKCAKCALKESDTCQNVLETEVKGAKHNLWLEANEVSKAFHETVCKEPKKATVTGKVKQEGGKMVLTAAKIELAK